MPFWTYMLSCRGGSFYAGRTDDLERRLAEHELSILPGFVADHRPFKLVWAKEFSSRDEAMAIERRIKGWTRARKMALIREIGKGSGA